MWLAEKTEAFGVTIEVEELDNIVYQLGAIDDVALYKIVIWCQNVRLVERSVNLQQSMNTEYTRVQIKPLELTLEGWEYYESIKSSNEDSKRAFMAMPFGKDDLDKVFKDYWKPAVEAAGFTLERLDDRQIAGPIDDRLRQTIRRSAFLICELTEANRGAYWEAGFAEGIGIPVIYTCREDRHNKDAHFDVSHHLCVIWNNDNLKEKQEKLTATIKETLHERLSS